MQNVRLHWLFISLVFVLTACSGSAGGKLTGDGGLDDDGGELPTDGGGTDAGDAGDAGDAVVPCEAPTCAELADGARPACGTVVTQNSCGVNVTVDCSAGEGEPACPGVLFCAEDPDGVNRCREPENTCDPLDAEAACEGVVCGTASDGCEGQVTCPSTCQTGDLCIAGSCVTPTCTPKTCETAGPSGTAVACGQWGDGCGDTLDCNRPEAEGGCAAGQVCNGSNGTCEAPACEPATAEFACTGTCGTVSDGCGGSIDCAAEGYGCPDGTTCGGGGTPGVCGAGTCDPIAAGVACAGKCGIVGDGCGGAYDCSLPENGGVVCTGQEYCGGGGVFNQCGAPPCEPLTVAEACTA
jgi:hypothetical protein